MHRHLAKSCLHPTCLLKANRGYELLSVTGVGIGDGIKSLTVLCPTLEMGIKWFWYPETKVYAEPDHTTGLTDVRRFIRERSLTLEVDAEMEAVVDTFRGVENVHGVFHWEGSSGNQQAQNEQMHHKHVENYGNDRTYRPKLVLQDDKPEWINNNSADNWVKLGESQRKRLLSYLWKILPQRTLNTEHSVELIEFARDLGNANSTFQAQ